MEKEVVEAKYAMQEGEMHKLQVDYEILASDTKKLVQVERVFNEMK